MHLKHEGAIVNPWYLKFDHGSMAATTEKTSIAAVPSSDRMWTCECGPVNVEAVGVYVIRSWIRMRCGLRC